MSNTMADTQQGHNSKSDGLHNNDNHRTRGLYLPHAGHDLSIQKNAWHLEKCLASAI